MAYTSGSLHLIGGSSVGNNLYHYDLTTDTLATMMADGYFNNSDDTLNLAAGDMILLNSIDNGTVLAEVTAVTSNVVTLGTAKSEIITTGSLVSSVTTAILNTDVIVFTPTSITLNTLMASLPKKGQKLTLINQGISSSVTMAIQVASGAKVFSSDDLTSVITVKGGGVVTLLAVTSSTFMKISEGSAVAPSTSPDVTFA